MSFETHELVLYLGFIAALVGVCIYASNETIETREQLDVACTYIVNVTPSFMVAEVGYIVEGCQDHISDRVVVEGPLLNIPNLRQNNGR